MRQITLLIVFLNSLAGFAQCITADCYNGEGKYKFKYSTYNGEFLDGVISGTGILSTKKGYSYNGNWLNGKKEGFGLEIFKRGFIYSGDFLNNQRNGYGEAFFKDTKFMQNAYYAGNWHNGTICGEGTLSYSRTVKYGREKIKEFNLLEGNFISGVFQGRITSPYVDELVWGAYNLKTEHFQKNKNLVERDIKRLKNLATIEGEIVLSCQCVSGLLIFEAHAIFRKNLSWWSTKIPSKTKEGILNTMQGEFDIIEWHARELEVDLNKKILTCNSSSVDLAWSELLIKNRESDQVRKLYITETAWNPYRGGLKNSRVQQRWNNKIAKNLNKYAKINTKKIAKINKAAAANDMHNKCLETPVDSVNLPGIVLQKVSEADIKNTKIEQIEQERVQRAQELAEKKAQAKEKRELLIKQREAEKLKVKKEKEEKEEKERLKQAKKEAKKEAKKSKPKKSFEPHFPRDKQLE